MTSGKNDSKECLKILAPKGVQKFCRIAGFGLIYCDSKCPLSYIYLYIYFLYIFGGKAGAQQLRCPFAQDQRLPMNQCWLNQLIANPATFNLAVNHVAVPSEIANESALVS